MEGEYMKTESGLFVAWSSAPPPHSFGDWSLVKVNIITTITKKKQWQIEFVRAMTTAEVAAVTAGKLCGGMQLPDGKLWALVKWQPSAFAAEVDEVLKSQARVHRLDNPLSRVGV